MTKRIQAYFRTEDEAEGAKTALIAFNVEGLDVWKLTDPLGRDRNILVPLVPFNNTAMASGSVGTAGMTGSPAAGAALVPGVAVPETLEETENRNYEDQVRESNDVKDGDMDDLHYVMELKVAEDRYNEVVQILRGKHAFVEIFE